MIHVALGSRYSSTDRFSLTTTSCLQFWTFLLLNTYHDSFYGGKKPQRATLHKLSVVWFSVTLARSEVRKAFSHCSWKSLLHTEKQQQQKHVVVMKQELFTFPSVILWSQ